MTLIETIFYQEKGVFMQRGYFFRSFIFLSIIWLAGCSGGAGVTSMTPSSFVSEAAAGGMAEVQLGNLALTRSQNDDVKQIGQQMILDHTKANIELTQLATKKSFTIPTELDSKHKSTVDKLSKLSGAEFDKEYIDDMVKDHEEDIKAFQTQADSGTDPDVKAYAAKTLPILQSHLEMIRGVQSKMK